MPLKGKINWTTTILSLVVSVLGGLTIWMFTNISSQNQTLSIILTKFENVSSSISRFEIYTSDHSKKISMITQSIDNIKSTIEILETARNKKVTRIFQPYQQSPNISMAMVTNLVEDKIKPTVKKVDSLENIIQTNSNATEDFKQSKNIMTDSVKLFTNNKPLDEKLFENKMEVKPEKMKKLNK